MAAKNVPVDWTQDELDRLGKVPDRIIAEEKGITVTRVWKARKDRGIPACQPNIPKLNQDALAMLGTVPDRVIARRYNCHYRSVQEAREKRGIPVYTPPTVYITPLRPWTQLKEVSDEAFYVHLSRQYQKHTGESLSYAALADMTHHAVSELQHWLNGIMPLAVRHHLYLAVKERLSRQP